jgi:hypothetical protein
MKSALTRSTPPKQLLARILEEPDLVAVVQRLEPRALGKLIDHVGLEDSGELVSLATTEQLRQIFDEDLWRSPRPGTDEIFDAARFALWLEILLEAGEDVAAHKLAELDQDLLTLALCKQVLVINIEELAVIMSESERTPEADLTDKVLESSLNHEIEEFRVIARDDQRWDALLTALLAMDKENHALLRQLLERCCAISNEYIEDNGGLYNVLTTEEMLESDLGAEREDRREQEGYVAPSSAASFLSLARVTSLEEIAAARTADVVSQAHFRSLRTRRTVARPADAQEPDRAVNLVRLLREADVLPDPQRPVALLEAPGGVARLVQQAIVALRERDPAVYAERMQQLAYLANVLLAGCSVEGRRFRAVEAAEAVVATCNLGLDHVLQTEPKQRRRMELTERAVGVLATEGAVKLFRIGWRLLHELSMQLARATLAALRRSELSQAKRLVVATTALTSAVAAGKPWLARGKLDVLTEIIDAGAVETVRAALDEHPWAPAEETGERPRSRFVASLAELQALRAAVDRALGNRS